MPVKNTITLYEFSRWAALMEAVDIIAEKCKDKKINFYGNEGLKYIKPLDILEYVDKRSSELQIKFKVSQDIEKTLYNIKNLQLEKRLTLLDVTD